MLQWIYESRESSRKKILVSLAGVMVAFFCVFIFSSPALAQPASAPSAGSIAIQGTEQLAAPLGLPATDIRLIVANIIRVALGLVGLVFLILVLYGGYLWMTAGGNEEQIGSAKKVLVNSIIGLIIILSAYGIVIFVMRLLGIGAGGEGAGGISVSAPTEQNFVGSGGLGTVIKDHYPSRGQTDVPRNTKIIITFRKPIKIDSVAVKATGKSASDTLGGCVNIGQSMSWKNDCDQLILDNDHINIVRVDSNTPPALPTLTPITGAAILASFVDGKTDTIVLRPLDSLGNSTDKVTYAVHVGNKIIWDDAQNPNIPIFNDKTAGHQFYEWQFITDTALDNTPPFVTSVFPGDNTTEAKNSVIQVAFSEAIDPTGVQGSFSIGPDYYSLSGNSIFLKQSQSTVPLGNFRLTNGYRTLEFTPTIECGVNACGGKIYCLPVCDKPGASCQQDSYEMLLKAAQTFSASAFESVPFSGIADMAGNALDGNNNGNVNTVIVPSGNTAVFPFQKKPDNYFWSFNVSDGLDITAPYLKQVSPGVDATYVSAQDEWSMLFSKRMRVDPMYNIEIKEKPEQIEPLCKVPRVNFNAIDNTTLTTMGHCPFLSSTNTRQYYWPVVDSRVEDVHFNCFYPGLGPVGVGADNKSLICDADNPNNCCSVVSNPESAALCCNGLANQTSRDNCLNYLDSISPP